ncbi:hypothetical protein BKA70DRAFT_1233155 [Coprinopsis sp. MPI-PUGE-AT-0042]|nr:hypothetical protein BKA70DRAFT_1233155 [Coprinopsis sp. MPI-PUGE-AT-0042]
MPCYRATAGFLRSPQIPDIQTRSAGASSSKPDLSHFLRQIQSARFRTAHSPAHILHWDSIRDSLREWAWPADNDTGERIPPSELENHRRTHFFTAPCCLCAFSLDETFVESRIGLAVVAPGGDSSEVVGEYVAQCASNQCGYFDTPLAPEQLSYICDAAPNYGEPQADGLAQALPSSGIWSRGTRTPLLVEKPLNLEQACTEFSKLWARGVEEEIFWRLFVQCALCRMVMPRDVFCSTHGPIGCWMRRGNTVWPLDCPEAPENTNGNESVSGDTEIVNDTDDDTDNETDDEMPPLEDVEYFEL